MLTMDVSCKKINSQPPHLGSFILSHSNRLLNDVILAIEGFKNNKINYSDTDSVYIHNDDYEVLKTKGFIGRNIYQSRNNFCKGGILHGLFSVLNIQFCIVFDENGKLSQKTTFKAYDQNMVGLNFRDFLDLKKGDTILGKSKLNWRRDIQVLRSLVEYSNARSVIMIKYANNVRYLLK